MTAASGADQPGIRDQIAEELSGWPIGSGYYSTTVGTDEAREMADALLPVVERAQAEAAAEAITDLCDDLDHGPLYAEATRYFADRDVDADGLDVARIIRAALRGNPGSGQ